MENLLDQIIATVKRLPVDCTGNFEAADAWVGVVLALEALKPAVAPAEPEQEEEDHGG